MDTTPPRILVVEDHDALRHALTATLEDAGYAVEAHPDGGVALPDAESLAMAVLDVNLGPGPTGLTLARRLRADTPDLPIIFLTSADSLDDRLAGFAAGADDYLTKPFAMVELLARIKAVLWRTGALESTAIKVGDLVIDDEARLATRADHHLDLTRVEFDLLRTMAEHAGKVLSKTQLLSMVWGFDQYDPNIVEVYVSTLRRKTEAGGARLIHTVRGVGYVLRP